MRNAPPFFRKRREAWYTEWSSAKGRGEAPKTLVTLVTLAPLMTAAVTATGAAAGAADFLTTRATMVGAAAVTAEQR